VAGTFIKGDRDCESTTSDLQDAVTSFNEELISLCAFLGIRAVTKLEDIAKKVDQVNEGIRDDFIAYLRGESNVIDATRKGNPHLRGGIRG